MSLLPLFQWMTTTSLAQYFSATTWSMPIVQVIHLVAVALFSGAVIVVDLRLMGHGLTGTPIRKLAKATEPYLILAFVVLLITGTPQMFSLAMKQYFSPFFWWKAEAMLAALILTVTVRRKMCNMDDSQLGSFWPKVVGLTSLGLWTGVIVGARLIGLLS